MNSLAGANRDCPFCAILTSDAKDQILHREHGCIVIEPNNPVAPGHLLVIPETHTASAAGNPKVAATAMYAASLLASAYQDDGRDCNIITSCGPAATQTVYHLHLHVIPRHPADGLTLPWTQLA